MASRNNKAECWTRDGLEPVPYELIQNVYFMISNVHGPLTLPLIASWTIA
jgi:hypothetical protein